MTGVTLSYTLAAMDRPLRAVRCPLLIGRDDLLELTDRRLDDVLAGHGQFLLLAGQAGIGKTRLLGAIRRKAEARGFAAVEGAVAPQDHDVPASSILDLARSMVRIPAFARSARRCSSSTRPSSPRSTPSAAGSSWRPWS